MIGLGLALLDIIGSTTVVGGAACVPTSPASLAVSVGPGRIYSLENVDNTAYGSLAADTTDQIVKQGIQFGSVTLSTPAPTTTGQSINYLIEAAYQDVDTDDVVLNFFNAANPAVPFNGQNNSGAPLPTVRSGQLVLQAKAGIPATTGSQTTPSPDSGFVALYVVTVANGQTTVTSSNISLAAGAPFNQGSFIGTLTGCTTAPEAVIKWAKNGSLVTAIFPPTLVGTSNSTTCTITGLPANLIPSTTQTVPIPVLNSGGNTILSGAGITIDTSGGLTLSIGGAPTAFSSGSAKGFTTTVSVSWLVGV
jgi:hypothetical protein